MEQELRFGLNLGRLAVTDKRLTNAKIQPFYNEEEKMLHNKHTANISVVKITLFNCVRVSTVISL